METYDKLARRRIVGARALGARSQTVDLIGRRIDAAELGDGEDVLDCAIESDLVKETASGRRQCIAESDHVELEVIASLEEIVAHDGVGVGIDVEILAVGFLEHIAREVAGTVIEIVDIEDVETEGSAEEESQVEVLVTEVMPRRHRELGHTVADDTAVGVSGL